MKKSLFAIAAAGAFAGAAQAQSSVSVYGLLDVGYAGSNSMTKADATGGSVITAGLAQNGGITRATYSGIGQSGQSTSRLGFRGNEDLGGGTSAFFTIEFGIYPQEQNVSGISQGGMRNRQTFVGLAQKGLGKAALGTQYTPVHLAVGQTDPGMQNNQTGSVIYTGQGDGFNIQGASYGNSGAYQTRYANSLTFDTENMGGVQGHAMVVLNNLNSTISNTTSTTYTSSGGKTNTNGWVVGLDYSGVKNLFVTANYSQMKQITDARNCTPASINATTAPAAGSCGFAVFGQASSVGIVGTGYSTAGNPMNVVDTTQYYGATYDFGIVKAYLSYIDRKATTATNSSVYTQRKGQQIGFRGNLSSKVEGWVSGGTGKYTPYGSVEPSANFTAWQIGSNYLMSKRTNLYAIYGAYNQSQSMYATTLTGSNTNSMAVNANSYAVGIRHTF